MTAPEQPANAGPGDTHRLELNRVTLVRGGRTVEFRPGFNIILGDITTGKTTFVRLIRAMLGTFPDGLPPEVSLLQAIRGHVALGTKAWQIYRPRTTTSSALVEVSEERPDPNHEPVSLRLPVAASTRSYSLFLLDQLHIPAVSVPQARSEPNGALTPVTMTDWLNYCIVTGDELDTQVFGHLRHWRDLKRRWVFELAYGYYEPELARLNAELRRIELQLDSLEQDAAIREKFLADTPFADMESLRFQIAARETELADVRQRRLQLGVVPRDVVNGVRLVRRGGPPVFKGLPHQP